MYANMPHHPEAVGITDYNIVQCLSQNPAVVLRLQWCLVKCGKYSQSIMNIKWYSIFPISQEKGSNNSINSCLVNGLQLQVLPPFHLLFILKLVILPRCKSDSSVVEQMSGDSWCIHPTIIPLFLPAASVPILWGLPLRTRNNLDWS